MALSLTQTDIMSKLAIQIQDVIAGTLKDAH